MKVDIIGLTERVLRFNALNIVIHGKQTAKNIEIANPAHKHEVNELERMQLIKTIIIDDKNKITSATPVKKAGRPKRIVRVEEKSEKEPEKTVEKTTENPAEKTVEKTEAQTEKPAPRKRGRPKKVVPPNEEMGGIAVIGTGGKPIKKRMVKSIVPDVNNAEGPFIDEKENEEKDKRVKEDNIFIDEQNEEPNKVDDDGTGENKDDDLLE